MPLPQLIDEAGPNGGPSYIYRGAVIHEDWNDARYELVLNGLPASPWKGLGDLVMIQWVVDMWLDARGAAPKD
jgi:hypothetical protein